MNDKLVGTKVPHVKLESSKGGMLEFPQDISGKWTLLYFYPKDDTPGCTKQACTYRDQYEEFKKRNINLFGVSLDDLHSHDAFIKKFNLNFPLLADTKHELSAALGSYGEQEWKGKKSMGLSRDTFLIDPKGEIKAVWRKVDPTTTVQETYEALQKFL
jgi:peroxiredoxin Q/BCP